MLTIAQTVDAYKPVKLKPLTKAHKHVKAALKAFENAQKPKFLRLLHKAYLNLPHTDLSLPFAADIVETYIQVGAYQEAIALAGQIERQFAFYDMDNAESNFHLFRLYSNLAQAYDHQGHPDCGRHYYLKAMDYQLNTQEDPDLELFMLMMNRAG